jgi:hypothetical protein
MKELKNILNYNELYDMAKRDKVIQRYVKSRYDTGKERGKTYQRTIFLQPKTKRPC